jgi:FkbM family methyltransferase
MRGIRWKRRLAGLVRSTVSGMDPLLAATGVGRLRPIRALRDRGRQVLLNWCESGEPLLIEVGGHPMYVFNRTHFVGVYLSQSYEPYTVQLFEEMVRPGATVLDIGANVGYFSLVAARQVGAQGRVYAFEPGPDNFALLLRNIEINKLANITAVPKAVSNESKTTTLTLAELPDQHSLFAPPTVAATGTIPIQCVAVDDFLAGQTVDVIKIDVEGNELRALDGMRQTVMKSTALVMFVEFNPASFRQAGVQPEDLISKLQGLGFELRVIEEDTRSLTRITDDFLRQVDTRPTGWFVNLLCTKGSATRYSS